MGGETKLELYPVAARLLEVARVEQLTPKMVRVTLTGGELAGLVTKAPTDHVKLLFAAPGEELPVLPAPSPKGGLAWPSEPPFAIARDYTVRRYDPEASELDVDMALHGDGPGATWAAQAAPGQRIGAAGPRGSEIVAGDYEWYLLAGDETALPAIAVWLKNLPEGARARVFLEVADAAEEQPLPTKADATITWLYRGPTAPGESGLLERAIKSLGPLEGDVYAWVAGETLTLKPVRRYLRSMLPRTSFEVDGYWRRGLADFDHHEIDEEDEG